MNTNHEVISAFLDDEPFEPQALAEALADPAGRELLIDFVLVRHVAAVGRVSQRRHAHAGTAVEETACIW